METCDRDPALSAAWRLFIALHDAPSNARAEKLVRWLAKDPRHARALDDALTLWALAGAALLKPPPQEEEPPRQPAAGGAGRLLQ